MTVELVTASLHAFRVTLWTLATRIFLAYFMDSDSSIAERELDSLDQLSVTPERVRFLVHHSRPVRVQHIRQVTNVHCIDVLFEQPFTDMLDCCVSTVIVFPRSLVVQQACNLSRVPLESFELGASVVHAGFSSAGDDGKRVVRAYVDGCSTTRVLVFLWSSV